MTIGRSTVTAAAAAAACAMPGLPTGMVVEMRLAVRRSACALVSKGLVEMKMDLAGRRNACALTSDRWARLGDTTMLTL